MRGRVAALQGLYDAGHRSRVSAGLKKAIEEVSELEKSKSDHLMRKRNFQFRDEDLEKINALTIEFGRAMRHAFELGTRGRLPRGGVLERRVREEEREPRRGFEPITGLWRVSGRRNLGKLYEKEEKTVRGVAFEQILREKAVGLWNTVVENSERGAETEVEEGGKKITKVEWKLRSGGEAAVHAFIKSVLPRAFVHGRGIAAMPK